MVWGNDVCYAIAVAMTGDDVSDGLGDNAGRGSETGDLEVQRRQRMPT
jgi:hypothetical protein